MSIQTKDAPTALSNLSKAKGQNFSGDRAVVQKPAAVIVENQHTEELATPEQNPESQATSNQNPAPVDESRDSTAYKELKQYHDKTVHELRVERERLAKELEEERKAKAIVKAPKTPEEMKAFREQYGEAADYMKTLFIEELQNDPTMTELRSRIEQVSQLQNELKEKEAFNKLLAEHPDAAEIRQDPKFAKWYNEQPEDIKRIISTSLDPRALAKQLTLYKLEVLGETPNSKKKAKAQENVDASLSVEVNSRTEIAPQKKIWTWAEINDIAKNYKLWLKHGPEIEQARREGRVK